MSPPSLEVKNKPRNQRETGRQAQLGLFFDREDIGDMLL
jgi:hypothetical protein